MKLLNSYRLPASLASLLLVACGTNDSVTVPTEALESDAEVAFDSQSVTGSHQVALEVAPLEVEVKESEEATAGLVTKLYLENGMEVDFVAAKDDSVGIGVGGRIGDPAVKEAMALLGASGSPAHYYSLLAPAGSEVPAALLELSERAVAAGTWQRSQVVEVSEVQAAELDDRAGALPTIPETLTPGLKAAELTGEHQPVEKAWDCNNLRAFSYSALPGYPLSSNHGNCEIYNRNVNEITHWTKTDIVAGAAHVMAYDGDVWWDIQKQNCNSCNWYFVHEKRVREGYHYYYSNANTGNDFNFYSRATSLSSGGRHVHDVATCHDWYGRAFPDSVQEGGCAITYEDEMLFCSPANKYHGIDPSNIWTGQSYMGDDRVWPYCN